MIRQILTAKTLKPYSIQWFLCTAVTIVLTSAATDSSVLTTSNAAESTVSATGQHQQLADATPLLQLPASHTHSQLAAATTRHSR